MTITWIAAHRTMNISRSDVKVRVLSSGSGLKPGVYVLGKSLSRQTASSFNILRDRAVSRRGS